MSRSAWLAAVRSGAVPSRLAAVGAVGVAAAVVAAPVAHAGTPAPAATSAGGSTPSGPGAEARTSGRALKAAEPLDEVTPNFGFQKIRVGVQREDGATFPPDSTLVGATITAVQSQWPDDQAGGPVGPRQTFHCTVTSDPLHPDGLDGSDDSGNAVTSDETNPIADCTPDDAGEPIEGSYYLAGPGDYVTFTETRAPDGPGMLADTHSYTIKPCVLAEGPGTGDASDFPVCDSDAQPELAANTSLPQARTQLRAAAPMAAIGGGGPAAVFIVRPIPPAPPVVVTPPPTAVDDSATTLAGTPVVVPVLANDSANGGGALSLSSVSAAAHGTAVIDGSRIDYTPAAGFVGTDTFAYTASTPFGSSTATVTVTVTAPTPSSTAPSTPAPTTSSAIVTHSASPSPTRSLGVLPTSASRAPGPPLANTGIRTGDYLGTGAGLVAVGGLLTLAGRRRRRAH